MSRLLIVEDSVESFELARRALGTSSHIEWAKSIAEANRALDRHTFDLVLLDISLPDGDGLGLCSLMQTHAELRNLPVIFLSGRNSIADRVMGFSVGADDFICKPFEPLELKARVEAKLRRHSREMARAKVLHAGDLEINKDTQRVSFQSRVGDSVELDLTPIEFKILLYLANRISHVFSREDVMSAVWGANVYVYPRNVDTHVSKLRKKLGPKASYIQSVHGSGYRFSLDDFLENREAIRFCDTGLSMGQN